MTTLASIALGGNQGDVPRTFDQAFAELNCTLGIRVVRRSSLYRTAAIGTEAGSDYINAAALLEVQLSPLELLSALQRVEHKLGRVRTIHWGARTLDLDLLSYGDESFVLGENRKQGTDITPSASTVAEIKEFQSTQDARLIVPHPACWYRRFVLDPWVEIAPDWRHPVLNETVQEMHSKLLQRPLSIQLGTSLSADEKTELLNRISETFDPSDIQLTDESPTITFESRVRNLLTPSPPTGAASFPSPLAGAVSSPSPLAGAVSSPSPLAGAVSSPSPLAGEGGRRPDEGANVACAHQHTNPQNTQHNLTNQHQDQLDPLTPTLSRQGRGSEEVTPSASTSSPPAGAVSLPSPHTGAASYPSPLAGEGGRRPDEGANVACAHQHTNPQNTQHNPNNLHQDQLDPLTPTLSRQGRGSAGRTIYLADHQGSEAVILVIRAALDCPQRFVAADKND